MKIGLLLAGGGGMTVRDMATLAERAERHRFDGVYVVEAWRSAPTCLAAIAAATEKVSIGPYVMNAHARLPWIAGMTAVDLDEVAEGRLVMAIGSGNRVTNERYQGVPVVKPLEKMGDYLRVARAVTSAAPGDVVEVEGNVHSSHGWVSQVQPLRPRIDFHLAATSPRMEGVAAEHADGIALGSLISVELAVEIGERCRVTAGRDFAVRASAFVAIDDNLESARTKARMAIVNLYAGKPHPHYDALLRRQGFDDVAENVSRSVERGKLDAALEAVSDEAVDQLAIAGSPEQCREQLARYEGVVDEMILMNVGAMRFVPAGSHADRAAPRLVDAYDDLLALPG